MISPFPFSLPMCVCVCVCVCVRFGASRLLKNITIPVKLVMSAPVICVKTSDPASKAFDTISRRGISGLAVTKRVRV
jgi:CBS domain-containing protein